MASGGRTELLSSPARAKGVAPDERRKSTQGRRELI